MEWEVRAGSKESFGNNYKNTLYMYFLQQYYYFIIFLQLLLYSLFKHTTERFFWTYV